MDERHHLYFILLQNKFEQESDINKLAEVTGSLEGTQKLLKLLELSKAYGFYEWLVFDPLVVRGLSYYTGIVFEGFDRQVTCGDHDTL